MSRYTLDCGHCGEPVSMGRARYLSHVRAGTLPLCRTNGCHLCSRVVAHENSEIARKAKHHIKSHVAGKVFVLGRGARGQQAAPFATGKIRRCGVTTYTDEVSAEE